MTSLNLGFDGMQGTSTTTPYHIPYHTTPCHTTSYHVRDINKDMRWNPPWTSACGNGKNKIYRALRQHHQAGPVHVVNDCIVLSGKEGIEGDALPVDAGKKGSSSSRSTTRNTSPSISSSSARPSHGHFSEKNTSPAPHPPKTPNFLNNSSTVCNAPLYSVSH